VSPLHVHDAQNCRGNEPNLQTKVTKQYERMCMVHLPRRRPWRGNASSRQRLWWPPRASSSASQLSCACSTAVPDSGNLKGMETGTLSIPGHSSCDAPHATVFRPEFEQWRAVTQTRACDGTTGRPGVQQNKITCARASNDTLPGDGHPASL
jgi:hypothetical protein